MRTIKEENKFISFIFFHMIIIIYKSFKCIQYPHYKIIWMYTWRTVFWSVSFGNNCSREQKQLKWEIIVQNLRKMATDEKKTNPKSLVKNQNLIVFNAMNYLAEIVDSLLI